MSEVALLYTIFADRASAEQVADLVLAERLAACVNILAPCASIYRWQGRIERAEEVPVLFKTGLALAPRLRERLAALHPYDLPVIEDWSAATSADAAAWIAAETAKVS